MSLLAVAALYRFVRIDDPATLVEGLQGDLRATGLFGTLLIAEEGINGTIAGADEALRDFVRRLMADPRFADADVKWSTADAAPFRKARVKLKKEIVTLGVPELDAVDPANVGRYVDAAEWNALLDDPLVTVVDTRNDYEVDIGTFHSASGPAINPETGSFRDFPTFVAERLDPAVHERVAMFCTGGIRCEKSTALLKSRGFKDVIHLRGGILRYLENVPEANSKFDGACFVFDRRVAVTHGLAETSHELCFACGWATTLEDRAHADYAEGVSCPRCVRMHTAEQRTNFAMRQAALKRGIRD